VTTIADYSQVIRLKPDYTLAYLNRGIAFYAGEEYRKAVIDDDRASTPAATKDLKTAAKLFQSQNNQAGDESVMRKLEKIKSPQSEQLT